MKDDPDPIVSKKEPASTGITLFLLVGGFILLIMIAGWVIVAMRH